MNNFTIRAIYMPDIKYGACYVFEKRGNYFVMMQDDNYMYEDEMVYDDNNFILFKAYKNGIVKLL